MDVVASGRAGPGDIKLFLGHVEIPLEEEAGGGLALPPGMLESRILAAGTGVALHALCPPIFDTTGPYAGGVGLEGEVMGYNYGRFWHQNCSWGMAMREVGAWVETEESERGKEIAAFASPAVHPAVAHYFHAGLTAEDVADLNSV